RTGGDPRAVAAAPPPERDGRRAPAGDGPGDELARVAGNDVPLGGAGRARGGSWARGGTRGCGGRARRGDRGSGGCGACPGGGLGAVAAGGTQHGDHDERQATAASLVHTDISSMRWIGLSART